MRWIALACLFVPSLAAQDPREIVRKSVELDQANWLRMKDYTWIARETTRSLDSQGKVKSEDSDQWETVVLFGEPHRRMIERNGKPLSEEEKRKEQQKLDKVVAKLDGESEAQRQHRLEQLEKERQKDREFLLEVSDLYDLKIVGEPKMEGRDTWEISATPKPDYQPKHRDAKALMKIQGKIWIDKAEFQWVRIEAETTGTISYGLFLARLNPGAKLVFEQTRVNDEIWLPKFEHASGSGRLGLVKKISQEQDLTWSNYRKFQVESKIVSTQ
jgi:hypothetical protein